MIYSGLAFFLQNGAGGKSWQKAAKDEAHKTEKAASSSVQKAKDSARSTYHDAKQSAKATAEDIEEGAKSALSRLRQRLDEGMHPDNLVDQRLSVGIIPSNTEARHQPIETKGCEQIRRDCSVLK